MVRRSRRRRRAVSAKLPVALISDCFPPAPYAMAGHFAGFVASYYEPGDYALLLRRAGFRGYARAPGPRASTTSSRRGHERPHPLIGPNREANGDARVGHPLRRPGRQRRAQGERAVDKALAGELGDGVQVIKQARGIFDTMPLSIISAQTVAALGSLVGGDAGLADRAGGRGRAGPLALARPGPTAHGGGVDRPGRRRAGERLDLAPSRRPGAGLSLVVHAHRSSLRARRDRRPARRAAWPAPG